MGPCTAPTYSSTAKPGCGCAHQTETAPVPVFHESRAFALEPVRVSLFDEDAGFPSGLMVLFAAVALFAWTRQRAGAGLVQLHLARPETPRERRRFRRPRLALSERERHVLEACRAWLGRRVPGPALVPLRAAISRRSSR